MEVARNGSGRDSIVLMMMPPRHRTKGRVGWALAGSQLDAGRDKQRSGIEHAAAPARELAVSTSRKFRAGADVGNLRQQGRGVRGEGGFPNSVCCPRLPAFTFLIITLGLDLALELLVKLEKRKGELHLFGPVDTGKGQSMRSERKRFDMTQPKEADVPPSAKRTARDIG